MPVGGRSGVALTIFLVMVSFSSSWVLSLFGVDAQSMPMDIGFDLGLLRHFLGFVFASSYELIFGVTAFAFAASLIAVIKLKSPVASRPSWIVILVMLSRDS